MDRRDAEALDAADPLAGFRERFDMPPGVIYLDGNSLGPLPRAATARMERTLRQEWGRGLIRSWNTAGWIDAPQRLGAKLAPLIGAKAHEVIVADSTSANLFKLAAGALTLAPGRRTLITDAENFPTDIYVLEGLCAMTGADLRVVPAHDLPDGMPVTYPVDAPDRPVPGCLGHRGFPPVRLEDAGASVVQTLGGGHHAASVCVRSGVCVARGVRRPGPG